MRSMVCCIVSRVTLAAAIAFMPNLADAASKRCARPAERTALELRVLQSELMVAALTCDYQVSYNAFVTKFQPTLSKQGPVLKKYFQRVKGDSTRSLDRFITSLANGASQLSRTQGQAFCAAAHAAFTALDTLAVSGLTDYAASWPRAKSHGEIVCAAGTIIAEADEDEKTTIAALRPGSAPEEAREAAESFGPSGNWYWPF